MKTFLEYLDEANNLSSTEKELMSRFRNGDRTHVNGKREVDAAKKLVTKGLAKSFNDYSAYQRGEYSISPFTRKPFISKTIKVYGGELVFEKGNE